MSSSKRPGTVDYSKWDNFEDSDESEAEEEQDFDTGPIHQYDDYEEEEEGSYDDEEDDYDEEEDEASISQEEESSNSDEGGNNQIISPRRTTTSRHLPHQSPAHTPPSLTTLQRAWNTDLSNITRPCSNCFQPEAKYRCSRCQLVRYCNVTCQSMYHSIHKLECIDAGEHQKYWGMFDGGSRKGGEERDDFVVLKARRSTKRREYTSCCYCVDYIQTLSCD